MRVLVTGLLVGAILVPYAAGYVLIHDVLVAPGGIMRSCADVANETLYYPVNYAYQRWHWHARIPYSGRLACTFLQEHAGSGYVGAPMDGTAQSAGHAEALLMFSTWDRVKHLDENQPYQKAKRDYDAWYQKALRGEVNPGVPIASLPDFFHATFIITYTQRLSFSYYKSRGETEIEFLSIEGRGLSSE
jgi:hypothetical protein